MGVKIGQLISLPSININLVVIPGDYILPSGNTYTNLPSALAGRSTFMSVRYENSNTTILTQEVKPAAAGAQSIYRRTGSQVEGFTLHGTFVFNGWYSFVGSAV